MTAPAPKHWMRLPGSSLYRALLFIAWSLAAAAPARSAPPLPVVGDLELDRYVGTWYEIARYPNFFERHCVRDVTASYARNADGTLRVVNACRKEDGRPRAQRPSALRAAPHVRTLADLVRLPGCKAGQMREVSVIPQPGD